MDPIPLKVLGPPNMIKKITWESVVAMIKEMDLLCENDAKVAMKAFISRYKPNKEDEATYSASSELAVYANWFTYLKNRASIMLDVMGKAADLSMTFHSLNISESVPPKYSDMVKLKYTFKALSDKSYTGSIKIPVWFLANDKAHVFMQTLLPDDVPTLGYLIDIPSTANGYDQILKANDLITIRAKILVKWGRVQLMHLYRKNRHPVITLNEVTNKITISGMFRSTLLNIVIPKEMLFCPDEFNTQIILYRKLTYKNAMDHEAHAHKLKLIRSTSSANDSVSQIDQ